MNVNLLKLTNIENREYFKLTPSLPIIGMVMMSVINLHVSLYIILILLIINLYTFLT